MKHAIRNSEGFLTCLVGKDMLNTLIRRNLGEYSSIGGREVYIFREVVAYGNHDISVIAFPGSYIELDARY